MCLPFLNLFVSLLKDLICLTLAHYLHITSWMKRTAMHIFWCIYMITLNNMNLRMWTFNHDISAHCSVPHGFVCMGQIFEEDLSTIYKLLATRLGIPTGIYGRAVLSVKLRPETNAFHALPTSSPRDIDTLKSNSRQFFSDPVWKCNLWLSFNMGSTMTLPRNGFRTREQLIYLHRTIELTLDMFCISSTVLHTTWSTCQFYKSYINFLYRSGDTQ
jgi:hypothetical protein